VAQTHVGSNPVLFDRENFEIGLGLGIGEIIDIDLIDIGTSSIPI